MININLENWHRKSLYEHFLRFKDPYFGVTVPFDLSFAYNKAKQEKRSFFGVYLHACMLAVNEVPEFKLRIMDDLPVKFDTIHASATIIRPNKTFGFSFINFDPDLEVFLQNIAEEKRRIENSDKLFPPINGLDCIHCSAIPWINFSGHKEPVSGQRDSIPKFAFSNIERISKSKIEMNTAINVNHALVDGYHVGQFCEKFQHYLNS